MIGFHHQIMLVMTRCILGAALALLLVGEGVAQRIAVPESPDRTAEILQKLERPLDFDFQKQPLNKVAAWLSEQIRVPIRIDKPSLEAIGSSETELVSLRQKHLRAIAGISRIVELLGLSWTTVGETLVITTYEEVDSHLYTRKYNVRDLAKFGDSEEAGPIDLEPLTEIIRINCAVPKPGWPDGNSDAIVRIPSGTLLISQTMQVHYQIQNLLRALRCTRSVVPWANQLQSTDRQWMASSEGHEILESLIQGLDTQCTIRFQNVSLEEAVTQLANQTSIPIGLDYRSLEFAGISPMKNVTGDFHRRTVREVLYELGHNENLDLIVKHDQLLLTTWEERENSQIIAVYPVQDLLLAKSVADRRKEMESLMTSVIDRLNASKSLSYDSMYCVGAWEDRGVMVVSQTLQGHAVVQQFLADLRANPTVGKDVVRRRSLLLAVAFTAILLWPLWGCARLIKRAVIR